MIPGGDLSLAGVWDAFQEACPSDMTPEERAAREQLERFDPRSRDGIRRDLLAIEASLEGQPAPQTFLRRRLMDLVDRRVGSGELRKLACGGEDRKPGPDRSPAQSLDLVAADCDVQIAVLRAYAQRNFGDAGADDWFAAYQRLSEFYHSLMARGLSHPLPEWFEFDGRRLAATRANMMACRDACLEAPAGRRFRLPPDPGAAAPHLAHPR